MTGLLNQISFVNMNTWSSGDTFHASNDFLIYYEGKFNYFHTDNCVRLQKSFLKIINKVTVFSTVGWFWVKICKIRSRQNNTGFNSEGQHLDTG